MRDGRRVIYQATFVDGAWRGLADFLERQPDGGYEAVDTKLARHARPAHVLQLCFYTEQIARIQGRMPAAMHVVNGLGERETFRPDDYLAYYRRRPAAVPRRDRAAARPPTRTRSTTAGSATSSPSARRAGSEDDHLTLVAGISRAPGRAANAGGIATLEALGDAPTRRRSRRSRRTRSRRSAHQAELQLHRRRDGRAPDRQLPLEPDRGFALLPGAEPRATSGSTSRAIRGSSRRAGSSTSSAGSSSTTPASRSTTASGPATATRSAALRAARRPHRRAPPPLTRACTSTTTRRTSAPRSARLMGEHGTREDEIDDLLRGEVLVDLFRVTRQALRASVAELLDQERSRSSTASSAPPTSRAAASRSSLFEEWLEVGEDSLLEAIRAYNEEDCVSLYELHRWLLEQRPPELAWRAPPEQREVEGGDDGAARGARARRRALSTGAEEGEPAGSSRTCSSTTAARRSRSGGSTSTTAGSTRRSCSTTPTRSAASSPSASRSRTSSRSSTRSRSRRRSTRSAARAVDPETEKSYDVAIDDEHGLVAAPARRRSARTSRCRGR